MKQCRLDIEMKLHEQQQLQQRTVMFKRFSYIMEAFERGIIDVCTGLERLSKLLKSTSESSAGCTLTETQGQGMWSL